MLLPGQPREPGESVSWAPPPRASHWLAPSMGPLAAQSGNKNCEGYSRHFLGAGRGLRWGAMPVGARVLMQKTQRETRKPPSVTTRNSGVSGTAASPLHPPLARTRRPPPGAEREPLSDACGRPSPERGACVRGDVHAAPCHPRLRGFQERGAEVMPQPQPQPQVGPHLTASPLRTHAAAGWGPSRCWWDTRGGELSP